MAKNPYGKTRPASDPYATYSSAGWTWLILKMWQSPEGARRNPHARVFCRVSSPFVPEGELGDVYVRDIVENASLVSGVPILA